MTPTSQRHQGASPARQISRQVDEASARLFPLQPTRATVTCFLGATTSRKAGKEIIAHRSPTSRRFQRTHLWSRHGWAVTAMLSRIERTRRGGLELTVSPSSLRLHRDHVVPPHNLTVSLVSKNVLASPSHGWDIGSAITPRRTGPRYAGSRRRRRGMARSGQGAGTKCGSGQVDILPAAGRTRRLGHRWRPKPWAALAGVRPDVDGSGSVAPRPHRCSSRDGSSRQLANVWD